MNSLVKKPCFFSMPKGFNALFFTQLFSTISFAVMYATLVLYMKQQLRMTSTEADLITGVYFACNFALHLLSGYLGGRLFSYRGLVVIGVFFQLIGCLCLSHSTIVTLYWGMACMLVGTGTMVTCLNMLISQLFQPDEVEKRQTGFLWNYSGMNVGFLLGFTLAGYYQIHVNYTVLFFITAANNVLAFIILLSQWECMADKNTIFSRASRTIKYSRNLWGLLIILILVPVLHWLLLHTHFSDDLVLTIGVIVALCLLIIIARYSGPERNKFLAFYILLLSAQIFWIVYQLAPMCLTLFAKYNVHLQVAGFQIAPAWIQNINSLTIVVGGPVLGVLFIAMQRRRKSPLLPLQFSTGLALSGLGLLILPIGIVFAHNGYVSFIWLFATYVLQAIAELCISPIGYSMVGQLVPIRWQSLCMGSTLLNSGVAAVLASYFSNYAIGKSGSSNPLITNPSYSHSFYLLGWMTLSMAIILFMLQPLLHRLMRN
ncbi:MAG: POT family protein [Gammaproteobacteria bacterium RIFCSPHIGHO2_12_FULL_38_11]|nr:MAG: POT family protein [Gammaproteobacteria bacterium RIFCSPHIGHO2_12_FULL_38_11]